jgi:hypothetical protein
MARFKKWLNLRRKEPRGRQAARFFRKTVPLLAKFRRRSINENELRLFRASRHGFYDRRRVRNQRRSASFCVGHVQRETEMDKQTKHEIVVIALSTLAAVPVMSGLGFVVVSGIIAW